jgi:hypothetical protein
MMEVDQVAAGTDPHREGAREATPDSATWDVGIDQEIELLGDHEPVDEVDLVDERWAPGEPPPGVPGDEVLHVHLLTESEPPAEELDISERARDDLALAPDELFEGEEGEESR